jgi:hypothetical protein
VGALRRWLDRLTETDEARLDDEIREWSKAIAGTIRIEAVPLRQRVRIAGQIRRLTVFPMEDDESLEAHVNDGTGEIVVRFMGRRSIRGLGLGTKVVLEGVLGEQQSGPPLMINPRLEFTG